MLNFYYIFNCGPPLWSSDQSSWLQIQRSGFDSRRYQIFWEVVGLERDPLSLMIQLRSFLEEKVAAPVKKTKVTAVGYPSRWPRVTLYPQKLALTLPTSGGSSVSIVLSRTQATEFFFHVCMPTCKSNIFASDKADARHTESSYQHSTFPLPFRPQSINED
jgi:hypothetical protein